MTIEANKAFIRRYKEDILNSRDLAALDVIVAEDYLDHAAFPKQGPGRAGLKQRVACLFEALVGRKIAPASRVVMCSPSAVGTDSCSATGFW